MFENFFLTSPDSLYHSYQSTYQEPMVAASVLIAIFACFCALEMVERLAKSAPRLFWLPVGTLILGSGIWSMHFIGMLAFQLDCGVTYEPWTTALSMLPGIIAAAVTLNTLASAQAGFGKRIAAGSAIAIGIGLMHFTGMAAIRLDGILRYDQTLFVVSLVSAWLLSVSAMLTKPLLTRFHFKNLPFLPSLIGGIVLGCAISSMHYIAMEAAYFVHEHPDGEGQLIVAASPTLLAFAVAAVAVLLMLSGVLFTYLGSKIAAIRQHMEAILTTTSQGFILLDARNTIAECNPAMSDLLHIPVENLIGQSFVQLAPDVSPASLRTSYRQELMLQRGDGSQVHCLAHGNSVFDAHGEWLYAFALFSDISQQKQHERQILENEQNLLDILNLSPIAVRIATQSGRKVVFFNARYAELISNFQALGDDPRHYYARQQDYDEVLAQLAQGQTVLNRQIELRIPGHPSVWVLASYMPMRYQGDDAVLGWFYDITERIEAQAALTRQLAIQRQIEETLRIANVEQQAIFDAASSGIILMKDRKILRCNRKLEEIFGYEPGELNGQPTRIWFPDDIAYEDSCSPMGSDIGSGNLHRRELPLVRKNGTTFWARMAGQALNPDDPNGAVVGIIEDITLEREALDEMCKAKELAEEAARIKSDFLANMSHEIRTPMNAIIGLSHLLTKTELTTRQQDYLKKIRVSSQHLLGVINDILDFSKIEAGKLSIECVEFDLEHVMSNVSGLLHDKAAERGLEIIFDVGADVPDALLGDPLRLGQILLNFGSNAVKFTEQGEISFVIRKLSETEHDVLLKFSVRDTGIGLRQEQIDKLFQSFQQADSSTTRRYGGTGLGLVICKRLVELMQGEIGVHSVPGQGTEFWFSIHLGKGKLRPRRSLIPRPDLRGKRMLIVDDNENARTVVADLLASMSFVVKEAASGAEAIDAVRKAAISGREFDALFIDWQMPNMDGIEVARTIIGMGLTPQPKLFLVTAYGREEVLTSALQAGFDEVLIKPIAASVLFDSIVRVFGADLDDLNPDTAPTETTTHELARIAGARILVVEDNEMNQQIARELLEDAGLSVDLAVNGEEAVAKVQQHAYDLVLMDMQMPVMDGLTATRAIRERAELAELPIVAMTANAMQQDRERCLAAGMNDHLAKPIEPDDLWAALLKWIQPKPVSTPASLPVASSNESSLAIPTDIPGLDTSKGLRRVVGKRKLYLSLLENFVAEQADTIEKIQAALAQNDQALAERLAHTLKGLAGNLGASPLQQLAGQLEAVIHEKKTGASLDVALAKTADSLNALVSALQSRLMPQAEMTTDPTENPAEIMRQLAALLADDNAESAAYFDQHAQRLLSAISTEYSLPLQKAISLYEFDKALKILQAAQR